MTASMPRLSDQVAASTARLGESDGSALWLLLAMYRAFAVMDRDQVAEVGAMGLTTLQFNILNVLHRAEEPMTMSALASLLVIQPTNLSSHFNALADKGYVRRDINETDRRSLLASLTPQGRKFLETAMPGHFKRLETLMAGLTPTQRVELVALLKLISTSIEAAQPLPVSFDVNKLLPKKKKRSTESAS